MIPLKQTAGPFFGGIKLRHWKKLALGPSLNFAGIPKMLILPLTQSQGEPAEPVVQVGDEVVKYQQLAQMGPSLGAHLHAPTSGSIVAIEQRPIVHSSNLSALCIVIETDGRDHGAAAAPILDWQDATAATLIERITSAGIVGLGGAVFPTAHKIEVAHKQQSELLLINGAECEPYIACDESLMRHRAMEVLRGSQILARAAGSNIIVLAIEDQMNVTEQVLQQACAAHQIDDIKIVKVPTIYPEGAEDQLIKALTGQEVPRRGTPLDLGIVCQNVGTAKATYDAVIEGRPLISRVVSVTGRGFHRPLTTEALIGTPLSYLAELADGYTESVKRLVVGGPMMGIAVASDDRPLDKSGNCVLALTDDDTTQQQPELPCIRCMDCVGVCPAQLLPQQLFWHLQAGEFDQAESLGLDACVECGCCAYVCPSQIPLVDYYRYGKAQLAANHAQQQTANHARARFEAREERLARDAAERKQQLDQRQLASSDDAKQDAIAAAIARAQQRSQTKSSDNDS